MSPTNNTAPERTLGLLGATGVGVGAIVGGGILALAGAAFATTGPAAIVAFALNGVIALLTALSFAEMASKFPESGGTYTFSKKVLSVEAAFIVGWVVWFASVVAAVLYAIGFAYFATVMASDLLVAFGGESPAWLAAPRTVTAVAVLTTLLLAVHLMRQSGGGGQWVNVSKVAVFGLLILGGFWAIAHQPIPDTRAMLRPFFSTGFVGVIQAMGYTFIALQGFDLIAAVGGEVREPAKTLPRAMILSLVLALAIYLPLLFVVATVGTPAGQTVAEAAAANPEALIANAAEQFLGRFGYWLVIVAAVLSMFSALQANLFAASRIARAMARDRTLPSALSRTHANRGTPVIAIIATAALVSVILLVLPDVSAAGAASSLIFLITFALAHGICLLVRRRSGDRPPPFRTPLFPLVPLIGGAACLGLAIFQGIAVPSAGIITAALLGVGGVLFLSLFARRARVKDASSIAYEPELVALRGRSPLVLVPIANPTNAAAMVTLADALVPPRIGRVLAHTIVVTPPDWNPETDATPIERSQQVLSTLLRVSANTRIRFEALTTVSTHPMQEIARVAKLHRCESVLLGMSEISPDNHGTELESLLGTLNANVVVLRARQDWQLSDAKRVLIPVAGKGGHDQLLALLLASLHRESDCEAEFLRVVGTDAKEEDVRRAKRDLSQLSDDIHGMTSTQIIRSDDPLAAITEYADSFDLVILGVRRLGPREKLFGELTRHIATRTACPIIVISRRG